MMRRIFFVLWLLMIVLTGFNCSSNEGRSGDGQVNMSDYSESGEKNGPVIEFVTVEHDFGIVHEGEKVGWYFKYQNTGDQDLLIRKADATCGCTVPEFSKEPLPPGKEGLVKVVFDTTGRTGKQSKTITIESNDIKAVTYLKVMAEVIKK